MGVFFKEDLGYEGPTPKWRNIGCAVALFLSAVPVGCGLYSVFTTTVSAPGRVINRTLSTDNILQNYNQFFDRNANYNVRLKQITDNKADLAAETDPDEKYRLRTELKAVRYSCRELAASYNADSQKLTAAPFKSHKLPYTLNMEACDA